MLMGFISLCLLIVEDALVEWCVPDDGHFGVPDRGTSDAADALRQQPQYPGRTAQSCARRSCT